MQKTDLMFIAFAVSVNVRAAMHRITSLELLGTLIAVVIAKTSKLIDLRPTLLKIFFFSE